jgi:proteasome lid subunit RPN8/RPN11
VRPSDYKQAEAEAARLKGELLGFYHSHPDAPARPSQYDLDHAWPFFWYVIVSIQQGQPEKMTVWRLADDRSQFHEDSLAGA